jgi:HlyD family secretion protein
MPRLRTPYPAIVLLSLLGAGCRGGGDEAARGDGEATPAVEAVQARTGSLPLEERLSGSVRARDQVSVRAEISAPVVEVMVRSGASVRRGQPLVRLDDGTLREQLRQAEASVRLSEAAEKAAQARVAELKAQVVRARSLAAEALVSRLELETQEAQLAAAEASADQAQAQVEQARATRQERAAALEKTVVRAPVAGRVGRRNAEVGMLADTSVVLFEVGNLDELIVEIPLTGEMLAYIRAGQEVRVATPALAGEPLRARLSRISPFLAAGSLSTVGEVDLANPDGRLHPGMFVTVDVQHGESEPATLIPASALWEDPRTGTRGVFVVELDPGTPVPPSPASAPLAALSARAHPASFRPVQVLAEGRAAVGVGGVAGGEWVVTVGQHLLPADRRGEARVRPVAWERVLTLQGLQREDLLRGFLEKQQHLARTRGAAPPLAEEFRTGGAAAQPPASPAPRKGD